MGKNIFCIVAADASRARLFTFEQLEAQGMGGPQKLRERIALVDPARRRRSSELFSDTRPGVDRTPTGRGFALDDHRDDAMRRMDRDFAADIAREIEHLTSAHGCTQLILAASPRMLGMLREWAPLGGSSIDLHELDRDLVHLSSAQLHDYLAERELLPPRERIGVAAAP